MPRLSTPGWALNKHKFITDNRQHDTSKTNVARPVINQHIFMFAVRNNKQRCCTFVKVKKTQLNIEEPYSNVIVQDMWPLRAAACDKMDGGHSAITF